MTIGVLIELSREEEGDMYKSPSGGSELIYLAWQSYVIAAVSRCPLGLPPLDRYKVEVIAALF